MKEKLKALGLTRSKYGIGKFIFNNLYLHHTYIDKINDHTIRTNIQMQLHKGRDIPYNIIKYDVKTNKLTFIICSDFDTANEPLPDMYINHNEQGVINTKGLQIWHHKWMFVDDDYMGFDVEQSMSRSYEWVTTMKHINYRKIGQPSFWDEQLKKYKLKSRS